MTKINNLDEAVLNISKGRYSGGENTSKINILYSKWCSSCDTTIGDFYSNFVEPRLPDYDIMLEWHKVLIEYSQMDGAIFPIRDGHSDAEDDKLKLRRGWLVRVDHHIVYEKKFSYMFTDNHLAMYIYKMALDGYCPTTKEFFDFMTQFKDPTQIGWIRGRTIKNDSYNGEKRHFISMPVHFGWIGKSSYPGNTESMKNAYINTTPAPTCPLGRCGYKLAHIFGVKDGIYKIDGKNIKWKDIKVVDLGEESIRRQDYCWDNLIKNFVWDRKIENNSDRNELRKIVVAHFLRFLDPLNHFLTPKRGFNEFTKDNGNCSNDIAEYKKLLSHMMFVREREFGRAFLELKENALYFTSISAVDNSAETINIKYYQNKKVKKGISASGSAVIASSKTVKSQGTNNKIVVFNILNDMILRNLIDAAMLHNLTDKTFTSRTFGISTYPFLVRNVDFAATGFPTAKFYSPETITIDGEEYRVCSQWIPKRIARLKDWHSSL